MAQQEGQQTRGQAPGELSLFVELGEIHIYQNWSFKELHILEFPWNYLSLPIQLESL